jgi:glycosyltransferase involved in cell wall biosynthesis
MACPDTQWMLDEMNACGIVTHPLDMKKGYGMHAEAKMLKFVSRKRFDVIHAHLSRAAYLSWILTCLRRVPLVCTVHVETREPIYRIMAKGSNRIVAVSNFIRGILKGAGIKDDYIDVVYHGTDFGDITYKSAIDVHTEFEIPRNRHLVGLIGRVSREKGHELAIEALPEIVNEFPDLQLMFVGREVGEFPGQLKQRVESMEIANHVTFTGDRADVPRLLDAMAFSILPSMMESFSLVALESMARGRAVVASRVGGLEEVVLHNETGYLVDQTPHAFASSIGYLLQEERERNRLGFNARQRVRDVFSVTQMVERLENCYRKASQA